MTGSSRGIGERQLLKAQKPELKVIADDALNAEADPSFLDNPITPVSKFFVRNNGLLPEISLDNWYLAIDGEVRQPLKLSLADLKSSFERVTITAVLECAGNGRAYYSEPTEGIQWGRGAVGCARWSGVRVADILNRAGLKDSAFYTGHYSPDILADGSRRPALSRGLPIDKALAPQTIIAFEMNDEPLPYLHGGPLRIVAPGFPGSAWQKWIDRIQIRDREHDGAKMTGTDYRLPTVQIRPGMPLDEGKFTVIVNMPVNSLITSPSENFVVRRGEYVQVRGFAWGGQASVTAVAVSGDAGFTWQSASLEPLKEKFGWRRFTAQIQLHTPGGAAIMSRAIDNEGRTQPAAAPWNPRGYCNNAFHRVTGIAIE